MTDQPSPARQTASPDSQQTNPDKPSPDRQTVAQLLWTDRQAMTDNGQQTDGPSPASPAGPRPSRQAQTDGQTDPGPSEGTLIIVGLALWPSPSPGQAAQ